MTKKVTAYVLNDSKLPFNLTIVDTPGFGDTAGLKADKQTTKLIKELFETPGKQGITALDAICLVVKSTDTRLTAAVRHNFNSVFQLFGKDVAQNVIIVATFSDASKPPVIATLREAEISYKHLTKVNNSAFFEGPAEDEDERQSQAFYWKAGMKGFDNFFKALDTLHPKSLQQSAEVLSKRECLENLVLQIQRNIRSGVNQLETMRQEAKVIDKYASDIDANKNFEYTVEEEVMEKVDISGQGIHTTTCLSCNFTCHKSCKFADDNDKK